MVKTSHFPRRRAEPRRDR